MTATALAFEDENRAEALAARIAEIAATPNHPAAGSLWLYRHCVRVAFEAAAALAEQPDWEW